MNDKPTGHRQRLLVLTSTFPRHPRDHIPGFVYELSTRLTAHFDVTVLAPHAPGLASDENWDGLRILRFRYAPGPLETLAYDGGILAQLRAHPWKYFLVPPFLFFQWWACRRLVREENQDVIHAHWLFPQGLAAVLGSRKPVVVTAHGSDLHSLGGPAFRWIQRYVLARSKIVAVVSNALADSVRDRQQAIRDLRILPMGVDLQELFTPSHTPRAPATFLFVGRLVTGKGLDILLKALALLQRQVPDARLVVIGDGPDKRSARQLTQEYGISSQVNFEGALNSDRLPHWYRCATALVVPSRSEGLGLVLIEAAGCECPIIASDLPAIHDILAEGESGLLVPAGSPEALAAAMHRVLQAPEEAVLLGQAARRVVLERFDWAMVTAGYTAAIEAATITPSG